MVDFEQGFGSDVKLFTKWLFWAVIDQARSKKQIKALKYQHRLINSFINFLAHNAWALNFIEKEVLRKIEKCFLLSKTFMAKQSFYFLPPRVIEVLEIWSEVSKIQRRATIECPQSQISWNNLLFFWKNFPKTFKQISFEGFEEVISLKPAKSKVYSFDLKSLK
jgi:hypothetical protein